MSARQLAGWMAYDALEPYGDRRADWHAASICAAFANVTLAAHGGSKRFRVKDFLLEFGRMEKLAPTVREGRTWQEMKMIARMCAADSRAQEAKKKRR